MTGLEESEKLASNLSSEPCSPLSEGGLGRGVWGPTLVGYYKLSARQSALSAATKCKLLCTLYIHDNSFWKIVKLFFDFGNLNIL